MAKPSSWPVLHRSRDIGAGGEAAGTNERFSKGRFLQGKK
jgi:hypothetical protein